MVLGFGEMGYFVVNVLSSYDRTQLSNPGPLVLLFALRIRIQVYYSRFLLTDNFLYKTKSIINKFSFQHWFWVIIRSVPSRCFKLRKFLMSIITAKVLSRITEK